LNFFIEYLFFVLYIDMRIHKQNKRRVSLRCLLVIFSFSFFSFFFIQIISTFYLSFYFQINLIQWISKPKWIPNQLNHIKIHKNSILVCLKLLLKNAE
jgi:hypothetical protein